MSLLEALSAAPRTKLVLAAHLDYWTSTGKPDTRRVELEVQDARLHGVPIISDGDGYRYAQTADEAYLCALRLQRRAANQFLTARALRRAAKRMEQRDELSLWDAA